MGTYPPHNKPRHAGYHFWGANFFCVNTCGPVFALAPIQESILEEFVFETCIRTLNPSLYIYIYIYRVSGCIHTPLVPISKHIFGQLSLVRMQEKCLANYLCIGFVPGGMSSTAWAKTHSDTQWYSATLSAGYSFKKRPKLVLELVTPRSYSYQIEVLFFLNELRGYRYRSGKLHRKQATGSRHSFCSWK